MKLIGVTGTNGKTTITYLIEKIFSSQFNVGVIGTINHHFAKRIIKAKNTTPGYIQLQKILHNMFEAKVNLVAMEVSSHGLDQNRIKGLSFDAAIFTNLTPEHLDYHKTIKNYFLSKAKLFQGLKKNAVAIINVDDRWGRKLFSQTKSKIITYGLNKNADIFATEIDMSLEGLSFTVNYDNSAFNVKSSLIGKHNIYNILAAVSCAISQNIAIELIAKGVNRLKSVRGRLQIIKHNQPFRVFVDYAHTPDALEKIICTLNSFKKNKLILVFGCGGDRDKIKRPKMGDIACRLADFTIITSDNPRSEDPKVIAEDIKEGFRGRNMRIELDRYKAISRALNLAKKDDIVLVCGKGHESVQIFKDRIVPFSDQKVIKCLLSRKL
ncbi:MAG: UDP-N-acetylmuramoyl-L-alanyl-D-glutamate--2,6-diaminopimelate ligase [Candidatus Omnitrophota bacterium]